jgi:hypothetical protein
LTEQLEQLPPEQEPHPPFPPARTLPPEEAKKTDSAREVLGLSQLAQAIGASAWLIERSASKRRPHS